MAASKGWSRRTEEENQDIEMYWMNDHNFAVAIKHVSTREDFADYRVFVVDKKNYGGAPISNRRKMVGSGDNKSELRSAVVGWMRRHPDATRTDVGSLQRDIRAATR
jgi:hypothetical protein